MNGVIFSKGAGVADSVFGKSQEPIRVMIDENVEAFRAANFDAIVERRAGAARQAALNEMRSTRRFEPVGGAAEPASDLTQEEMDWWKAFGFSEKKARYYHNKYKKER